MISASDEIGLTTSKQALDWHPKSGSNGYRLRVLDQPLATLDTRKCRPVDQNPFRGEPAC